MGTNPFEAHEHLDYPQLHVRAPRVGTLRRLPDDLAALIDACLEPDPAARPPARTFLDGQRQVPTPGPPTGS